MRRRFYLPPAYFSPGMKGYLPPEVSSPRLKRSLKKMGRWIVMGLIRLPQTEPSPGQPLEQLLATRRCERKYARRTITLANATSLLWAAQGVGAADDLRTAPSAGALHPVEIYLAAGAVDELLPGIYRYLPTDGAIKSVAEGDRRAALAAAALGQAWLADAALILVIAADYERSTWKHGRRGIRYVHMEAGHGAQNVLLMAATLNLRAAVVGAFDDKRVASVTELVADQTPLYLLPVGYPRG
jgi:SagB-type dehydrogenase family enzyme